MDWAGLLCRTFMEQHSSSPLGNTSVEHTAMLQKLIDAAIASNARAG